MECHSQFMAAKSSSILSSVHVLTAPSTPSAWKPPTPRFLKLNFDGATDHKNGNSGLGAVFRDHLGTLIAALAIPIVGLLPPRTVEILALLYGLLFASRACFFALEFEGDAPSVTNTP